LFQFLKKRFLILAVDTYMSYHFNAFEQLVRSQRIAI
jgi:hypothetical protein